MLSEAEKKVLRSAAQALVVDLFDTARTREKAEKDKAGKIAEIEKRFATNITSLRAHEGEIKRQLAELLVPNFDELTDEGREALITLENGYTVDRTRPESLEQLRDIYTVMGAIREYLVQKGDTERRMEQFITPHEPTIDRSALKKNENRDIVLNVPGLAFVRGMNLLYNHPGDTKITDKDVHLRGTGTITDKIGTDKKED